MQHKMQGLGFACAITGISGIAGAIERDTGMMQSIMLFFIGAFILYRGRKQKQGKKGADVMTITGLTLTELINDKTDITIRDEDSRLLERGNWYEDCISKYLNNKIKSFTWKDGNKIVIDLTAETERFIMPEEAEEK